MIEPWEVVHDGISWLVHGSAVEVRQTESKPLDPPPGTWAVPGDTATVNRLYGEWRREHPLPRGTIATLADHIDHIVRVAGVDHVGLGSDFDGVTSLPEGMEDVSRYPYLTAELLRRGHSEGDVRKILGGNVLRVMRRAEEVAARLQRERAPSVATIEQLDGRR